MKDEIGKILISKQEIADRIGQIAAEIDRDFAGGTVHVIAVLTGAVMFAADLLRALTVDTKLDFIKVSSYGSGTVSQELKFIQDLSTDIEGKRVLLVDDILDTGKTLSSLKRLFQERGAKEVKTAVCLSKPSRRTVDVKADYECFEIEDHFVIGYGLDYDDRYRGLESIHTLTLK